MNWVQFKVSVSHMSLAGTAVASWSPMQEGAGLSHLNNKYFYRPQGKVMLSEASVSHFVHKGVGGICLEEKGLPLGEWVPPSPGTDSGGLPGLPLAGGGRE